MFSLVCGREREKRLKRGGGSLVNRRETNRTEEGDQGEGRGEGKGTLRREMGQIMSSDGVHIHHAPATIP